MFWSQFVECYRYPALQHFDSLPHLVKLLRTADLPKISREMRAFSTLSLQKAGKFWRATLPRILSLRSIQVINEDLTQSNQVHPSHLSIKSKPSTLPQAAESALSADILGSL